MGVNAGRVFRRNKTNGRWHLGQLRNATMWLLDVEVKRIGNAWHVGGRGIFFRFREEYEALCYVWGLQP